MKNSRVIVIVLAALVILSFGCARKQPSADAGGGKQTKRPREAQAAKGTAEAKAPGAQAAAAAGKVSALSVLVDRNIDKNMNAYDTKNRNQVGDWMDEDLVSLLKKAGYNARLIRNRSEFKPTAGAYLLSVRIVKYSAGSKAARMTVGFGAGAASMNTRYELYGAGSKPILADDLGVGSGRDWRNVVRKINEQTVKAVSDKLGKGK